MTVDTRAGTTQTERTQVNTLSSSGGDQESSERLRISVQRQTTRNRQYRTQRRDEGDARKDRRGDESLSRRTNRRVEVLNSNLTEEDTLVSRVGEHVDEIDRGGERIGEL